MGAEQEDPDLTRVFTASLGGREIREEAAAVVLWEVMTDTSRMGMGKKQAGAGSP